MDRKIIDGFLHAVGKGTEAVAHRFRQFDTIVINGGVDWLKDRFLDFAQAIRSFQTGKVQEYLWHSLIMAWAFAVLLVLVLSR